MGNRIKFDANMTIGENGAENDSKFLFECFVDHPALSALRDLESPKNIALGSTGIGKTALIRMIEKQEDNCQSIELHEMAMNYIANSDTIQFLEKIDVDLSLFFQSLWRHVIVIEYIKLYCTMESANKFQFTMANLIRIVRRDNLKRKLEKFVEENENRFWHTLDENVIELTGKLENNIRVDLGAEIDKSKMSAGYGRTLSSEKKVQLQQRAKKFVDSHLLAELGSIITALAETTHDKAQGYFIVIDKLDEHWVDEKIKYPLIQSLFETIKSLQKLRNLKVVVALRNDIYEKMVREYEPSKAQLEKNKDFIVRLSWSKDQLFDLVSKRIRKMFYWQYSGDEVHFNDIFKSKFDGKNNTWNYLLERTLYRPRDVINFINTCIQAAEGKETVSKTDFLRAERIYSEMRREALVHEWSPVFPGISILLGMLENLPPRFEGARFCETKTMEELYYKFGENERFQKDELWEKIQHIIGNGDDANYHELVAEILHRLHLIGAVALKTRSDNAFQLVHQTGRPLPVHTISPETKVEINKMLWKALGINPHEGVEQHY